MARRLFEFRCEEDHVTEVLIDSKETSTMCSVCGNLAQRIISPVRSKLEGITGDFPTAYDRWATVHEQATRIARQRKREHTDPNA